MFKSTAVYALLLCRARLLYKAVLGAVLLYSALRLYMPLLIALYASIDCSIALQRSHTR